MEEKLEALAENEEFIQKLEQTESAEAAIKLFAEYGVEVTEDELKKVLATVPTGEVDEAALENVAGGLVATRICYYLVKCLKKWIKKTLNNVKDT